MNSSTYRLLIFSSIIFVATIGLAAFMLNQQAAIGQDIRARLLDLKAWESVVAAEGGLAPAPEDGENLQERLRSLVLLSESDTTTFLSVVEMTAASAGVSIRTAVLEEAKISDPKFKELSATFNIQGTNESVERMVKLLELLPYRSRVERLTLTRGELSSEALVVVRVSALK